LLYPNYIVLDAARVGITLHDILAKSSKSENLYSGHLKKDLEFVAPYLCALEKDSELLNWIKEDIKNCDKLIFIYSAAPFDALLSHLKKFIVVVADKEEFYFRFYDPVVLPIFLPTCTVEQIRAFFGIIQDFYCVDGAKICCFFHKNYTLHKSTIDINDFLSNDNFHKAIIKSENPENKEQKNPDKPPVRTIDSSAQKGQDKDNKWKDFFFK
jgi:hypothetical protein